MSSKTTSFNEKLFFSHEISHTGTAATVKILRGKTARFLNFLGRSLSYTSTRAYGSFMISFGLLSIFLLLGKYYFSTGEAVALKQLIVGAVLLVASIPLLCFDRPMCVALQDFPLTDYILFEFFSIKRMHRNVTHASVSPLLALFLGFIPAIVGFFLPVQYVALTVALLIVAIVAFTTPEFPMILTLLVLPYIQLLPHPNVILAVISTVSFLSFAIKVLLGKRVLYFDIYSVLILLAFLLVFIGGAAGGYLSFKNAVKVILFSLGYFPASSLIINRRLFDCAVNAIIVSSAPISVVAVVDFFTRKPAVTAFFPDSSTLAAYLTVSATLALAFAMQKHHMSKKAGYLTVFFAEIFVLGLVMQPIIWLTLFLTALACLILTSRKLPAHLALGLLFVPYLILLIPSKKIDALFVTLKISPAFSEKLLGYKNAASAFFKNPKLISGIGSTSSVMPSASDTPVSLNTPLGVGLNFGILVLVVLALMIALRIHHVFYYRHYVKSGSSNSFSNMSELAILALLIYGADSYVFSSSSVCYLFFAVLAVGASALRIAKKDFDDREFYYESTSSDSSDVDVEIRYHRS